MCIRDSRPEVVTPEFGAAVGDRAIHDRVHLVVVGDQDPGPSGTRSIVQPPLRVLPVGLVARVGSRISRVGDPHVEVAGRTL